VKEPQRIAKLLARAGVASRREIERMIADGRVALNGVALDTPATIVTSLRGITVDGSPVEAPDVARLFLFHKPVGLLTAERDPRGRPTIYDKIPKDLPRVVPVGRLDLNTEGLLLMTTDGGLKRKLELPANGIPRIYRARAYGKVTQEQLEDLIEGIEIDGVRYGSIDANMERRTGANFWIEIKITEGKNREVRRVLEHLGLSVSRLIRVAYGPFVLADIPVGEIAEIRQNDLIAFMQTLDEAKPADRVMQPISSGVPLRKQWRIKTPKPPASKPRAPVSRPAPKPVAAKPRPPAATETAAAPRPNPLRPKSARVGWAKAKPKPGKGPRK
jgi:23S rRNA pseudouridine2605 synthase